MRYFKFKAETPYAGCNDEYFLSFKDEEVTKELLDNHAENFCVETAERYIDCAVDWREYAFEEEAEEAEEDYYSGCFCYCEEITKEEYKESL